MLSVHPHIRGAYCRCLGFLARRIRFIPTYVGHTASNQVVPDHGFRFIPTYVGHTILDSKDEAIASGSSPHTWGILWSHPSVQFNMRFIPTYVGHTLHVAVQGGLIRFIPTYVGHTSVYVTKNSVKPVHPHIRGAYKRCGS